MVRREDASTRSALVVVRRDEDLDRAAVLADDAHVIAGDPRAQRLRESILALPLHAHLRDAVPVVLGAQLTHAAHATKRELEAMPVVGCRERRDHDIDLARPGRGARRSDRLVRGRFGLDLGCWWRQLELRYRLLLVGADERRPIGCS